MQKSKYLLFNLINIVKNYLIFYLCKLNVIFLFINEYSLFYLVFLLKATSLVNFSQLMDISVVDYSGKIYNKFEITYSFWSLIYKLRIFVKFFVNISKAILSLRIFFSSSDWLEREAWDMFGLKFLLHDDLRRILTDYGFRGHPLRKIFPLIGYIEVKYDEMSQVVAPTAVEVAQGFRFFRFENPWINWKI